MTHLDASTIIGIWEQGKRLDAQRRALLMLSMSFPEEAPDPAALPIGRRDALLYGVRVETFGDRFEAFARCPSCSSPLEFDVSEQVARVFSDGGAEAPASAEVEIGEHVVTVRPPATADLVAAMAAGAEGDGTRALLSACVSSPDADVDALVEDAAALAELEAALLRIDPAAELLLALSCPDCTHSWSAVFDIGLFLWNDISRAAAQLLDAVHLIASRYAWSEAAILNMSAARRQYYLDRILA